MKLKNLFAAFVLGIILFSCKSQLTIRRATWNNWSGGQPGVGGTDYQIVLNNQKKQSFTLETLTIDGKEFSPQQVTTEGDSIWIKVRESQPRINPTPDNPEPKRADLRSKDPETAIITGTLNDKPVKLEVGTFTQTKSPRYQ